ncbi:hypothetical protein [Streptomyces virginiae]|uniref:hypothetical protein n=1 Tax=Streptomyces virginiae TaxID=1961 RepID=UPI0032489EC9
MRNSLAGLNPLLSIAGIALIVVALVGFFQSRNAVLVTAILAAGVFVIVVAAFHSAMEGPQEFPGGGKINLRVIAPTEKTSETMHAAEIAIAEKRVITADNLEETA